MKAYLDICKNVLMKGVRKDNRTGIDTFVDNPTMFQHDMTEGFPLLTTKQTAYKNVRSELEFFIKGITDKKWLQDRGNHIWDDWCRPTIVAQGVYDDRSKEIVKSVLGEKYLGISKDIFNVSEKLMDRGERKSYNVSCGDFDRLQALSENRKLMSEERDLGPIYGFEWRHFGADYGNLSDSSLVHWAKWLSGGHKKKGYEIDYSNRGVDQLTKAVETLKKDVGDRRMIVSAWNPEVLHEQALPPCHYSFQVNVVGDRLNLAWNQRSVDVPLGLPFNIASYGTLLHLIAKEVGLKEGTLTGFLMDTHVYENQVEGLEEQMSRKPKDLPKIETSDFSSVFDWDFMDTKLLDYEPHPKIKFPIAV